MDASDGPGLTAKHLLKALISDGPSAITESVDTRIRIVSLPIKPIIFEHRNSHQLFARQISVEGRAGKIPFRTLVINQSQRRRVWFEKELALLTFNFPFKRADRLAVFTHNDY